MCKNYKYFLQVKPEFDDKFKVTGKHTQLKYLCEVRDVASGKVKLNYDKKRFNLLVKECGKCYVCRFKKASIKAAQAQCESKTSGGASFITLTFSDKAISDYLKTTKPYCDWSKYKQNKYRNYLQWTLEKQQFTKFMKRLRWKIYQVDLRDYSIRKGYINNYIKKNGDLRDKIIKCDEYDYSDFKPRKIRFLHCGEYGSCKSRPHHHLICYGITFSFDYKKVRWSWKQKRNVVVKFNHMLDDLWQFGEVTTDTVNYQACNYVARYITKKVYNHDNSDLDISGSLYRGRLPEYCTQSNRRGLGFDYYMQNADKINKDLEISFFNQKGDLKSTPLPRYFKELMRRYFPSDFRRYQKIQEEQSALFSSFPATLLHNREIKDDKKGRFQRSEFKGNFEEKNLSINDLHYFEYLYKKGAFGESFCSNRSYSDSDFVVKPSDRQICFNNFEKFRKHLLSQCEHEYVKNKTIFPNTSGLVLDFYNLRNRVKRMRNPFNSSFFNPYSVSSYNLVKRFKHYEHYYT